MKQININGDNICILRNGQITADGVSIRNASTNSKTTKDDSSITVIVQGNVTNLSIEQCNATTVEGNVADLSIDAGNLSCNDINGNVSIDCGNIKCNNIGGKVKVDCGNIKYTGVEKS